MGGAACAGLTRIVQLFQPECAVEAPALHYYFSYYAAAMGRVVEYRIVERQGEGLCWVCVCCGKCGVNGVVCGARGVAGESQAV